jgi:hypothetical protein
MFDSLLKLHAEGKGSAFEYKCAHLGVSLIGLG